MPNSPDVDTLLGRIMTLEVKVRNAEVAVADSNKELEGVHEALIAALKAGSTTGDPFRDEFIKMYSWNPAAELVYRDLNDQLKGHKGEFILLAYTHEVRMPGGMFRQESYANVRHFRLGVLDDETFGTTMVKGWFRREDGPMFSLPVSRYIERETEPYADIGRLELVEGNLFDQRHMHRDPPILSTYMLEKAGLWRGSETRFNSRHLYAHDIELIIGDDAVKAWLEKVGMADLYKPAAATLSKLILEPTDAT